MEPTDLTIEILQGIRDETHKTNQQLDELRTEVRAGLDELRTEVRVGLDEVRSDLGELRDRRPVGAHRRDRR